MAAPGTINFRVIADDYYAIVPEAPIHFIRDASRLPAIRN